MMRISARYFGGLRRLENRVTVMAGVFVFYAAVYQDHAHFTWFEVTPGGRCCDRQVNA